MLYEKVQEEIKSAMRQKAVLKLSTLRLLQSAIKYKVIELKVDAVDDGEIQKIIQKQVKQRQDSIASYETAGRSELAAKEKEEMEILMEFLPKPLSDEELLELAKQTCNDLGLKDKKEMGTLIKEVLLRAGGRADGGRVSKLSAQVLAG